MRAHLWVNHGLKIASGHNVTQTIDKCEIDNRFVCAGCGKAYKSKHGLLQHLNHKDSATCKQRAVFIPCSGRRPLELTDDDMAFLKSNFEPPDDEPIDEELPQPTDLYIYGQKLNRVATFKYLGRIITADMSDVAAVEARIRIAEATFRQISRRFFRSKHIEVATKVSVLKAVIQAQLIYGCESWTMTKRIETSLQRFHGRVLRYATGMMPKVRAKLDADGKHMVNENGTKLYEEFKYPSYDALLEKAECESIIDVVHHAQARFTGHLLRTNKGNEVLRAFNSHIEGRARSGFTNNNLLRHQLIHNVEARCHMKMSDAQDRSRWRTGIERLKTRKIAREQKEREEKLRENRTRQSRRSTELSRGQPVTR
jgi:hypothetical protein